MYSIKFFILNLTVLFS